MTEGFALYVHIPWCRHVCPYCDFNVYASARPPEDDYTAALVRELATWSGHAPFAGRRIATVFIGGGTPSLFSADAIARLLHAAATHFGIGTDAEITLEANPGTLDDDRLRVLRAAGVNRLSLGVQTFQPTLLRTLGRDHTPGASRAAVQMARAAGFGNVSVDLIFGVPGSRLRDWEDDLDQGLALAPDHVSAYALTFEERTPFAAWRRSGRITAVDEDEEIAMAEATDARLVGAGYARYEISSWARPGFASHHNQRYWDGSHYLGLGAGAHSFDATVMSARRWSNVRDPRAYTQAVTTSGRAIADEHPLDAQALRGDYVLTGLRRIAGIDAQAFERRFGIALVDAHPHVVGLVRDGLLEWAGDRLRLTPRGLRFHDTVAATFV